MQHLGHVEVEHRSLLTLVAREPRDTVAAPALLSRAFTSQAQPFATMTATRGDGHLKEPLLHMMSMLRALNTTTDGDNLMYYASDMRQEPFNSTTVFNFYPPNFVIPGTQLLGPEFKILNTSTTISRINFMNDLVYGSVGTNTKTDISGYVAVAGDVNKLLDMVSSVMLHGQMSDSMRSTLVSTLSSISDTKRRAKAALYLVGGSSQAQVQH